MWVEGLLDRSMMSVPPPVANADSAAAVAGVAAYRVGSVEHDVQCRSADQFGGMNEINLDVRVEHRLIRVRC